MQRFSKFGVLLLGKCFFNLFFDNYSKIRNNMLLFLFRDVYVFKNRWLLTSYLFYLGSVTESGLDLHKYVVVDCEILFSKAGKLV